MQDLRDIKKIMWLAQDCTDPWEVAKAEFKPSLWLWSQIHNHSVSFTSSQRKPEEQVPVPLLPSGIPRGVSELAAKRVGEHWLFALAQAVKVLSLAWELMELFNLLLTNQLFLKHKSLYVQTDVEYFPPWIFLAHSIFRCN